MEGDRFRRRLVITLLQFLSTPSGWRATKGEDIDNCPKNIFLSTPSGWRATKGVTVIAHVLSISIHARRVEGDAKVVLNLYCFHIYFYPRPPGGGRHLVSAILRRHRKFLSTPSGWRATRAGVSAAV